MLLPSMEGQKGGKWIVVDSGIFFPLESLHMSIVIICFRLVLSVLIHSYSITWHICNRDVLMSNE